MEKTLIIITLFSAGAVRLDEDSTAKVLAGDYPVRVKSKILATIREIARVSNRECVVGFLPVSEEKQYGVFKYMEDVTPDHYGELALYLAPEAPCRIVSDLITRKKDLSLACKEEIVRGNSVIVIGDRCRDWNDIASCLDAAGADSVRCISILD